MAKTLELTFDNASGKEVVLSIQEPKSGLVKSTVDTVAATIISKNIFTTTGGDLTTYKGAKIRTVDVVTMA